MRYSFHLMMLLKISLLPLSTACKGPPPPPPSPCFKVVANVPCSSAVVVTYSFLFERGLPLSTTDARFPPPPPPPPFPQAHLFWSWCTCTMQFGGCNVQLLAVGGGGGGGADILARVLRKFRGLEFGRVGQSWTLSRVQVAAFLSRGINYKTRGCRPCPLCAVTLQANKPAITRSATFIVWLCGVRNRDLSLSWAALALYSSPRRKRPPHFSWTEGGHEIRTMHYALIFLNCYGGCRLGWVATSCQPHRVISGRTDTGRSPVTIQGGRRGGGGGRKKVQPSEPHPKLSWVKDQKGGGLNSQWNPSIKTEKVTGMEDKTAALNFTLNGNTAVLSKNLTQ